MEEQDVVRRHIATHPVRYRIASMLLETSGSFAGDIAEKLEYDKRLITFHLMELEKYGLIETKLEETGKETPIVDRFASPTENLYRMEPFLSKFA